MIQVKDLHKSFGETHILKGIDATFERGQTSLIIGQSGSGKTVFLKSLLGLHTPEVGIISFDGKISKEMKDDGDISRMREERRDLYDLLYGDEPDHLAFDDTEKDFAPVVTDSLSQSTNPTMSFFGGADLLDDENLDDFDPYGLDDC